jgi:chromosome segregation ATPase
MINEQTTHLSLPLPHASNRLSEDVTRLRESLGAVDSAIHELQVKMASDDASLDSLQEVVTALKSSVASLGALASSLASHTGNRNNPHSVSPTQIGAISATQKGAAGGVATLDSTGHVPYPQIKSGKSFYLGSK